MERLTAYSYHKAVITGIGVVGPYGVGREVFWDGIKSGTSAVDRITIFDPSIYDCRIAAEVKNFSPSKFIAPDELKRMPRLVPMAIQAAKEALSDAGIDWLNMSDEERSYMGVLVGTGGGGIDFAESQYEMFFNDSLKKTTPYAIPSSFVGMLSSELSIYFKFHGISHVISTGCTSSTDAIGYSFNMIRSGRAKILLSGGADACITKGMIAGYCRMNVVAKNFNDAPCRASRPFNKDREGFVLGEGSWILVVEELEHALRRGARVYAELVGYGSTCDAFHRVQTELDGKESARAIRLALEDGGIDIDEIDYINLHGTSTRLNDITETNAIKLALGKNAYKIPTSATKSMIGHPQGASGASGLVAALLAMENNFIPPTINYDNPDPECDLNYTPNKGIFAELNSVLCNCIAFGSKNSVLIVRKL